MNLPLIYRFLVSLIIVSFIYCDNYQLKEHFLKDVFYQILDAKTINERIQYNSTVSVACKTHVDHYLKELLRGEMWALKMFDAGSKIPSGIMNGNLEDYGNYGECMEIETNIKGQMIYGKYCMVHVSNLTIATCIPDSCSNEDVEKIYSIAEVKENECQSRTTQPKLEAGAILAIIFFATSIIIAIVCTIYDIYLYYAGKESKYVILKAFSFLYNGKKLLTVTKSDNQISCLHGIRVIAMICVLYGHLFKNLLLVPMKNPLFLLEYLDNPANSYFIGGTVAVDTFLCLSGLMVSYSFLLTMRNRTIAEFNVPLFYFHRFLRLTPPYYAVILFYSTLLIYVGSGPMWPNVIGYQVERCTSIWWHALLYIQNYSTNSLCLDHAWYLAVDMQLYLLSPIILIPLKRWPKIGIALTTILCLCTILSMALIGWYYRYYGWEISNLKNKEYITNFYYPTHTRAAPWFIGIIFGYYIYQVKQGKLRIQLNKFVVVLFWIIIIGGLFACLFAGFRHVRDKNYEPVQEVFQIALVRPSWALGVGGVTFMCVLGYGGPINSILSVPVLQILSRLTYCVYLIHRPLQYVYVALQREVMHITMLDLIYKLCGDIVFSLGAGLMLSFLYEVPILTIEKIVFGSKEKKTHSKA